MHQRSPCMAARGSSGRSTPRRFPPGGAAGGGGTRASRDQLHNGAGRKRTGVWQVIQSCVSFLNPAALRAQGVSS